VVTWNITLEFGCVNPAFGPTDISESADYWKFGMWATTKNLTTGFDARTRLLLFFHKDAICDQSFPITSFDFRFNTSALESDPVTPISPVLYDGAGLFKSLAWASDPVLSVSIQSQPFPIQEYVIYPELKMPIREVRGAAPSGLL
jgi:hypothetical protein